MQDAFPIPSCFYSGDKFSGDPTSAKSGQSVVMSVYRTKIAGHSRLITVTWCRNTLVHGLSVSVEAPESVSECRDDSGSNSCSTHGCKVELRPWYFWRKHGSKRLDVEGSPIDVFWDLSSAHFSGEPEPRSDYYVAVVSADEVVLLLGDLKKEAYRRTGSRPAAIDASLMAKKEHVFGKKRFTTRAKFHEKGKLHEISIECVGSSSSSGSSIVGNMDPEMVIKIDGNVVIHVKHLQWKFRGNDSISISKNRLEVYWDVHDWLFSPGLRHAQFIFRPIPSPSLSTSSSTSLSSLFSSHDSTTGNGAGLSGFCLFLYAWKLE